MKMYVRCKACGFITEQAKLKDVCPACGVPAKMFEPYAEMVSEKRKRILDLHIHPVIVHAPQAFAFYLLGLTLLIPFVPNTLKADLISTMRVTMFCLPFTLIGAFLSGLYDGKIRFHRVTTPILRKKIALGALFFMTSLCLLIFGNAFPLEPSWVFLSLIAFSAAGFLCSAFLGLLGAGLWEAKFPG